MEEKRRWIYFRGLVIKKKKDFVYENTRKAVNISKMLA